MHILRQENHYLSKAMPIYWQYNMSQKGSPSNHMPAAHLTCRVLKSDVRYRFVINIQGTLVQ
jgi:hypothetical protein